MSTRKPRRAKEGILIKFKTETPILPTLSKLSKLPKLVDKSGVVSKAPPSNQEQLTLLLPRVSTVSSRYPIMLENRDSVTSLERLKSSFDFRVYLGASARISGDLEGNVNFITTCFGISADNVIGKAKQVEFRAGLLKCSHKLSRETRDLNKEYSDVGLVLVHVAPELVGNIVVPRISKKLIESPYNCAVIGGVPNDVDFRNPSVVKRVMENGEEVELFEEEKEVVLSEISYKLRDVFSGHGELIASFGETTLSSTGVQQHGCTTVEGLYGSMVRFVDEGEILSLPGDDTYNSISESLLNKEQIGYFHGIHVDSLKNGGILESRCYTTRCSKFIYLYCYAIIFTLRHNSPLFSNKKQYEASLEYLNDVKKIVEQEFKELKDLVDRTILVVNKQIFEYDTTHLIQEQFQNHSHN